MESSVCSIGEEVSPLMFACISWRTLSLPWSLALCTAVEEEYPSSFRRCSAYMSCITPDLQHSGLGRDPITNISLVLDVLLFFFFLEEIFLLAPRRVCPTSIHQWRKLLTLLSLLCKLCKLNSQDRSFLRYTNIEGR